MMDRQANFATLLQEQGPDKVACVCRKPLIVDGLQLLQLTLLIAFQERGCDPRLRPLSRPSYARAQWTHEQDHLARMQA